jgi:predicted deacetylase
MQLAKLIIRLDDVHPRMDREKFLRFTEQIRGAGYPALLGVVPDCQDPHLIRNNPWPGFWDHMRELRADGWVIAQHGFTHVYDKTAPNYLGSRNRSEFAGHPFEVQFDRLSRGAAILREEGLKTDVFMAPGHTFDATTLKALKKADLHFVTDGFGLWPFAEDGVTLVPQLVSGAHGLPFGVYTTCFHLDHMRDAEINAAVKRLDAYEIINFYEAACVKPPPVVPRAVRSVTRLALHALRKARSGTLAVDPVQKISP